MSTAPSIINCADCAPDDHQTAICGFSSDNFLVARSMPPGADSTAYDLGVIPASDAAELPSSPANVAKQLSIDTQWYMKFDQQATQAYQNMMTQ
jgi:hypothetical protein